MKHSRRSFIRTATLTSTAMAMGSKLSAQSAPTVSPKGLAKPPRRPNLLLLWTDQHRRDVVPWAGNRALQARNFFEPLGEKSFLFHRTCVTQPVCTPSRASIMTGLWPHHHGCVTNNIPLRPEIPTIADYLPGDYATAHYGKWHLGDEISAQHGFKDWRSIEDLYRRFYSNPKDLERFSDYHQFLIEKGFPPDQPSEETNPVPVFSRTMAASLPEPYTKAAFIGREAETFLRARRDGQPFILSVNTLEPHSPTYGPLNEVHDPAAVPVGPEFARPLGDDARGIARIQTEKMQTVGYKNHPVGSEADFRRLRANYYGLVTMVDNAFGRVMRALEASGQADNTIIVYTSDHGDMCGDHALMWKGTFYEGAIGVPLAIHVPWLSRQRVDFHSPISTIDLVPTLLDLMGIDVAGEVDGRSRAEALRRPSSWREENVTVEWHQPEHPWTDGRCRVTADGWKLNLYRSDRPGLYDLNSDPGELVNRAAEPAQRDRFHRLTEEIHAWQQSTGDNLPLQTSAS